jgi:pSer/pThr/pTyr-binding forkhead associated (FHA) protein
MIRLRPGPGAYDERYYLQLKGLGDVAEGETLKLCLGESVVCGRSRHCEWSLKRAPGYLKHEDGERREIRRTVAWRSTSRRHCRITYIAPDMVDIENLSTNGTLVDGHQVDRIVLTDCRNRTHEIMLGPHGITLSLAPGALPIEVLES